MHQLDLFNTDNEISQARSLFREWSATLETHRSQPWHTPAAEQIAFEYLGQLVRKRKPTR